ncbi:hypothetical protein EB796_000014 [Bugula neritina]|uniref:Uncharacterized protein n=1 Tax=Bugula neritina TaxID=10212 RepID=A0A7J7KU06_BUGNE|nr:hypothetical protein EB796_000014 [Bugula neritina]
MSKSVLSFDTRKYLQLAKLNILFAGETSCPNRSCEADLEEVKLDCLVAGSEWRTRPCSYSCGVTLPELNLSAIGVVIAPTFLVVHSLNQGHTGVTGNSLGTIR